MGILDEEASYLKAILYCLNIIKRFGDPDEPRLGISLGQKCINKNIYHSLLINILYQC